MLIYLDGLFLYFIFISRTDPLRMLHITHLHKYDQNIYLLLSEKRYIYGCLINEK